MKTKTNIKVTLNGHDITGQCMAAESLEGWVEIFDCYDRGRGRKPIVIREGVGSSELLTRRLYGDVKILIRGIPILRVPMSHFK